MDVDPVARAVAIAGLGLGTALGTASLGLQYWRGRHHVTTDLKVTDWWTPAEQMSLAIVSVTNVGRAMAVRDINIEWRDPRPQPRQFSFGPPARSISAEDVMATLKNPASALSLNLGLNQLLADGETKEWSYLVHVSPEALDDTDEPMANIRKIRAVVTMANDKRINTNEAYIVPGRLPVPASVTQEPPP